MEVKRAGEGCDLVGIGLVPKVSGSASLAQEALPWPQTLFIVGCSASFCRGRNRGQMDMGEAPTGNTGAVGVMGAWRQCRVRPRLRMRDSCFLNCVQKCSQHMLGEFVGTARQRMVIGDCGLISTWVPRPGAA